MQIQIHLITYIWRTSRTHLAGQIKQTYAKIWEDLFAKPQTLQWHLHVAKGSTVQFHAQEVIWEIGNFTLTGGPGLWLWMCCWMCCRLSSFIKCAGRAAKRREIREGARKIAILSIFTISWPSSRSISFSRVILYYIILYIAFICFPFSSWWLKLCGPLWTFHHWSNHSGPGRDPFDPYHTGNLGETKAADTRFVSAADPASQIISGMKLGFATGPQRPMCCNLHFIISL